MLSRRNFFKGAVAAAAATAVAVYTPHRISPATLKRAEAKFQYTPPEIAYTSDWTQDLAKVILDAKNKYKELETKLINAVAEANHTIPDLRNCNLYVSPETMKEVRDWQADTDKVGRGEIQNLGFSSLSLVHTRIIESPHIEGDKIFAINREEALLPHYVNEFNAQSVKLKI